MPKRQRKRQRLGCSDNSCIRQRAEYINHVWSYDFVMDRCEDGSRLKMLPIEDEFTRECFSIDVERIFTARDVISSLKYLFSFRAVPAYIRSDNGLEFIADAINNFLSESGVGRLYIEPGSPWENGYIESFISRFEDEQFGPELTAEGLLNGESFGRVKEAKVLVEEYRLDYNDHRPHSSLGYMTATAFAATCIPSVWATPRPTEYTTQGVENSLIQCGT